MATPTTTWLKLRRRLGHDGNPLRRPEDKLAGWITPAAVLVFLGLAPLAAIVASMWVHAGNSAIERSQKTWHSVEATLVNAAPGPEMTDGGVNTWTVWTLARWTAEGLPHVGEVPAAARSKAGSLVRVWLDSGGRVQAPPLSPGELGAYAETAMAVALAFLAMFLAGLAWFAWVVLERRRLASWGNAWVVIGPRWSRQR